SILGGEIRDTGRLKPALIFGAVLSLATKVAATLAALAVVPPHELAGPLGIMKAMEGATARTGLGSLLPVVALVVVVGPLGNGGAWSATGARLPMLGGMDRLLPPVFGELDSRGTPYVALLFQSAVVAVLVVVGQLGTSTKGAYDVFLSMTLIPTFVPFLFLFAAAIKVVWQERGRKRRRAEIAVLTLGLATTAGSTALAGIPPPDA